MFVQVHSQENVDYIHVQTFRLCSVQSKTINRSSRRNICFIYDSSFKFFVLGLEIFRTDGANIE
jgi:hypothetical protein